MTDQTPATEAGRRLHDNDDDWLDVGHDGSVDADKLVKGILAIEAEARADALREAAAAVRALPAPKYDGDTWTKDCEHGWDTHEAAVLAILDPQP